MSYAGSQNLPVRRASLLLAPFSGIRIWHSCHGLPHTNFLRQFGQSLYPATVQQLLRARQRHTQSNFYVDGIELDMVQCTMSSDNKLGYMSRLGHLRRAYC